MGLGGAHVGMVLSAGYKKIWGSFVFLTAPDIDAEIGLLLKALSGSSESFRHGRNGKNPQFPSAKARKRLRRGMGQQGGQNSNPPE